MRVLIADDESPARDHLQDLLQRVPGVEVIGMADSGTAAVAAITEREPDLVFLDIQMPGMNGFEVIKEIGPECMPPVIFCTAFDQYAIRAFDLSAIDYLLKPFDDERFEMAIKRAIRRHELNRSEDAVARLRQALAAVGMGIPDHGPSHSASAFIDRIAVELRGQVRVVLVKDVDFISASGVYAELHVGDRTHVVRERMQNLEQRLNPKEFFRIHRSIIVQLDRIDALLRNAGGHYLLRLKSGEQLPVSRHRIEELERWMGVPAPDG